jgi:hypothetical protein
MAELTSGLLRGPRFNPEVHAQAAERANAKAAEGDTDTDWRAHLIHSEPAEEDHASTSRRVPLPGDINPPSPFQAFLRDMACVVEGGDLEAEGRSELELSLHFLDRSSGQEKTALCRKLKMLPEECVRSGMPDLEALALDYAMEAGPWGPYKWNIRGWLKGELIWTTSQRINLMQPPTWGPKAAPKEEAPVPTLTPLDQLRGTLDLARTMREALGIGGGSSGMDAATLTAATTAAEMRAKYEMGEAHRKEVDRLKDEHRKEVDRFRDDLADLRRQLQEKEFELRNAPQTEELSPLNIFMSKLEPGAVNALLGGVAAKLMQPTKPAPSTPSARTKPELRTQSAAEAPHARVHPLRRPTAAASPAQALPEPTRAEAWDAVALLNEAADVELSESAEDAEVRRLLQQLADAGLQEGSLARWWATLNAPADPANPEAPTWLQYAEHRIQQSELDGSEDAAVDAEEPMDTEALKALLITRLEAHASDEDILAEIRERFTPTQIDQARMMLRFAPASALAGMLGVPQHEERLAVLRSRLLRD